MQNKVSNIFFSPFILQQLQYNLNKCELVFFKVIRLDLSNVLPLKNLWKNCLVSMLHNIGEPDKAHDKYHHLLNPFKSNETPHFYQMDQFIFVFRIFFYSYSNLIEHTEVSKQ